jgi:hypothetical protein
MIFQINLFTVFEDFKPDIFHKNSLGSLHCIENVQIYLPFEEDVWEKNSGMVPIWFNLLTILNVKLYKCRLY